MFNVSLPKNVSVGTTAPLLLRLCPQWTLVVRGQHLREYAEQKELLDQLYALQDDDIFVANYAPMQDRRTGRAFGMTFWADGMSSLLPRAVVIAVHDSGFMWNDNGAINDLRKKFHLNRGELPPHAPTSEPAGRRDPQPPDRPGDVTLVEVVQHRPQVREQPGPGVSRQRDQRGHRRR